MNPYDGCNFIQFFGIFIQRLLSLFPGGLVSDELQLLLLTAVSLSGAIVGTFLVLRRMTMLANALSHTILFGIVMAFLLLRSTYALMSVPTLMLSALLCGLLTTLFTELFTRRLKLQEDASIGLVFSLFFALGAVLITLYSRNVHIGTELVMGNADALDPGDLKLVCTVLFSNIILFLLLFRGFMVTSFDTGLSRSAGFSPTLFSYLLMVMTSLTSITTFRAVGVMMLLAFLTAPVLIARLWTDRLGHLIFLACGVGALSSFLGVAFSRHTLTLYGLGLSTGGLVVCSLIVLYLLSLTFQRMRARLQPS